MQFFLEPSRLAILLLLLPFTYLMSLLYRKRREALLVVAPPFYRAYPQKFRFLSLLVLLLLLSSLSRPYNGSQISEIHLPGRDILFLVDISKSMLAKDISPSRLAVAKRKLLDALAESEHSRRLDRIGIILFSARPYVFCPLSSDYQVLRSYIKEIDTELTTSLGTSLNAAVKMAASVSSQINSKNMKLVMLSDGEDSSFDLENAAQTLREHKLSLDIIGIGGTAAVPIVLQDGIFARDESGNIVYSRLQEIALLELAKASGGHYFRAQIDRLDIRNLLSFRSSEFDSYSKYIMVFQEIGPLLCVLALLFAAFFFHSSSSLFVLLLLISLMPLSSSAENQEKRSAYSLRAGYLAYKTSDYKNAEKVFRYFTALYPQDAKVLRAYADTLYRLGKYREALLLYQKLLQTHSSGRLRFELLYNLGNSFFALSEYRDAINAYNRALQIKEGDEHARYNRDLAELYLNARTQSSPPPSAGSENLKDTASPPALSEKEKSPSKISQENTMQQEELMLVPSQIEDPVSGKTKADSWLEAIPNAAILPEKDRTVKKGKPKQWW